MFYRKEKRSKSKSGFKQHLSFIYPIATSESIHGEGLKLLYCTWGQVVNTTQRITITSRSGEVVMGCSTWSFLSDSICIKGKRVERTQLHTNSDIMALVIRQIKLFRSENWVELIWKPVGKNGWSPGFTFPHVPVP